MLLNPKKLGGPSRSLGPSIGIDVEQAFAVGKFVTQALQFAGAALGLETWVSAPQAPV